MQKHEYDDVDGHTEKQWRLKNLPRFAFLDKADDEQLKDSNDKLGPYWNMKVILDQKGTQNPHWIKSPNGSHCVPPDAEDIVSARMMAIVSTKSVA